MPGKTLKNKKSGSRVIKFQGSPVPIVHTENTKRGITYKLPTNLLQPKDLLRAKQKNKANAAKLAAETRRTQALEAERARRERLESQERFAALLRAERARQAAQPSMLLKAFEDNNEGFKPTLTRGPGARGSAVGARKANVLKASKPTGKFWSKGENSNSSNSD